MNRSGQEDLKKYYSTSRLLSPLNAAQSPKTKKTKLIERVLFKAGKYDTKNYKSPRNLTHRGALDKNEKNANLRSRKENTHSVKIDLSNNSSTLLITEKKNQTQSAALYQHHQEYSNYASPRVNNNNHASNASNASTARCLSPNLTQRATITLSSHFGNGHQKSIDFSKMTSRFRSDDVHAEWERSRRASVHQNKSPDASASQTFRKENEDRNSASRDASGWGAGVPVERSPNYSMLTRMNSAKITRINLFEDSETQGLQQCSSYAKIEQFQDARERDFSSQIQTIPGPRSPSGGRETVDYCLRKNPKTIHILDQKIHESAYFNPEVMSPRTTIAMGAVLSEIGKGGEQQKVRLNSGQNKDALQIKIGENFNAKEKKESKVALSQRDTNRRDDVKAQIDVVVKIPPNVNQQYITYEKGIQPEDNRPKRIQYQMHDFIYKTSGNFLYSDENQ